MAEKFELQASLLVIIMYILGYKDMLKFLKANSR